MTNGHKLPLWLGRSRSRQQDVTRSAFVILSPRAGARGNRSFQIAQQARLFLIRRHDSVDNSGLPFSNRVLWFDEAQPAQVKQDAFVFAADHLIAPVMRFHFMADLASENG